MRSAFLRLFCGVGICCVALTATVAETNTVTQFPLGKINGVFYYGCVEVAPSPQDNSEGESHTKDVYVYYHPKGSAKKTNRLYVWESYYSKITHSPDVNADSSEYIWAGAYAFTKAKHKQLLVSTRLGQVCTRIYDLDPVTGKLRPIYSRDGDRVVVRPRRNTSGRYDLEEYWQQNQWKDYDDLGIGHYDRKTGYVTRLLHWDGTKFVPYHPGATRIQSK